MRFNTQSEGTKTTNIAGGAAFKESHELELISILLTSFAEDKFYRTASNEIERIKELIGIVGCEFSARAAAYARNEFGMRSITHVVASEIAYQASKQFWVKEFLNAVVKRPDDVTEILAYHFSQGRKLTNQMRKGLGAALSRFNTYQLGKYKATKAKVSLVDAVNLLHPKNTEALGHLIKGTLDSPETWEVLLTQAGSDEAKKTQVWKKLLTEKKLGYFALLRNIRNIMAQAPDCIDLICEQLVNEEVIKKSLVLPFRYWVAYKEILAMQHLKTKEVLKAIVVACELSVKNIPTFEGQTLVVLDVSSSMTSTRAKSYSCAEIGALFAAALCKAPRTTFMCFAQKAEIRNFDPFASILGIVQAIPFEGGGTNFSSIFDAATFKYDRVIILSDMQGWMEKTWHDELSLSVSFNKYKQRTGATPIVYSVDFSGYGTLKFPERNVYCVAGFSEKIFDIMKMLEMDKDALVNEIKNYSFNMRIEEEKQI